MITTLLRMLFQRAGLARWLVVNRRNWLTERQLTAKLAADGWKVKRMKKDGGGWEVYGNMPDGTFVEGYFHPASGEKLYISQRGKVLFKKQ